MAEVSWNMAGQIARLMIDGFEAELRVASPQHGLNQLRFDGATQEGHILGVIFSGKTLAGKCAVEETYLRGSDLISTYCQNETQPFRPQVYWRAIGPNRHMNCLAAVDLITSVETSLLDSQPELLVTSRLPAEEICFVSDDTANPVNFFEAGLEHVVLEPAHGWILYRLPGGARSCAHMVHPHDDHRTTLRRDSRGDILTECRLLAQRLEKGVILRARLRCVFVDRATDLAAGVQWYRALATSPLPLTA